MLIEAENKLQMSAENQRLLSHTAYDGARDAWTAGKVPVGWDELTDAPGGLTEKLLSWREICCNTAGVGSGEAGWRRTYD